MSETDVIIETRRIPVRDGQVLEVEMSQKFINHLRSHFGLVPDQPLTDDLVKMYVWGAVNTAVNKAERENTDVKPPADTQRVRRTRRRKKDAGG